MASRNSTFKYASSTALTVGKVATFFPDTDVPSASAIAEAVLVATAETLTTQTVGLNTGTAETSPPSGGTGVQAQTGNRLLPTSFKVLVTQNITFVAGTNPTLTVQPLVNGAASGAAQALVKTGTTALTAGQFLTLNIAAPLTTGTQANSIANADTFAFALAVTGSPTSFTAGLKIIADAQVVPV